MDKKQLKNDGFALASVLIIMLVLMILGTVLLSVVFSDTKHAIYSENNLEAHFLARSGADIVSNAMITNRAIPSGIIGVKQDLSDTFGTKSYTVQAITTVGSKVNVVVNGEANGITDTVTLELDVLSGAQTVFQRPFHVNNPVNIDNNNLKINYPVNSTAAFIAAHAPLSGNSTPPFIYPDPSIVVPNLTKNNPDPLTISNGQTINLNSSKSFTSIVIDDGKLEINTTNGSTLQLVMDSLNLGKQGNKFGIININGDGNLEIFVDDLTITQGAQIAIKGAAKVKIYVLETAIIDNPITDVSPNVAPDKLLFVLKENAVLDLGSNATMTGYIYGPKATIYMNSNSTTINGAIIGNVFNKHHSSNAPNGVINFILPQLSSFPEYSGASGYIKSQYKGGN